MATCSSVGEREGEICLFDFDGNLKMKYTAMCEGIEIECETSIERRVKLPYGVAFVHISDRYLVAGGGEYIYLFDLKEVENMYDLGRIVVEDGKYGHLEIYPY